MLSYEKRKEIYEGAYVESFARNQSPDRLGRLIQYFPLNQASCVVDFACGSGLLAEHLSPRVQQYVGVDFSQAFIEQAKIIAEEKQLKNTRFVCADIHQYCEENPNAFDIAFAMDFSEHVYDNEWIDILKKINHSIKPKGKIYIHTPNAEFFLEIMKEHNFIVKQFEEHIAVRTPQENMQLLQDAGFVNTRINFIPHYNVLKYVHPLSYLPFVGKYFRARLLLSAEKAG